MKNGERSAIKRANKQFSLYSLFSIAHIPFTWVILMIKVLSEQDPFTIIILVSYSQAHLLNISQSLIHKGDSLVFRKRNTGSVQKWSSRSKELPENSGAAYSAWIYTSSLLTWRWNLKLAALSGIFCFLKKWPTSCGSLGKLFEWISEQKSCWILKWATDKRFFERIRW